LWLFYFLNRNKQNIYTQIKKEKVDKKKKDDDYNSDYEQMKNYKIDKKTEENNKDEKFDQDFEIEKEKFKQEIEIQENEKHYQIIKVKKTEIQINNNKFEENTTNSDIQGEKEKTENKEDNEKLIENPEDQNSFEIIEDEEVDLNIDDLISEFLDYIQNKKVIHLSDLSDHMNTSKHDTINKLRDVESDNQFGFVDKSGRYINLNEQELALFEKLLLSNKKKIKKSQLIKEFSTITGVKK